jgi:hypothetical protein
MTEFSNLAPISASLTIASLNSISSGAYSAPSSLVDNTATTKSYLSGWVRLAFGGALTAGSGAPFITLFVHEARDGTNVPSPPGASAAAPSPNARQATVQLVPSGSFQVIDFPMFDLGPFQYAFQVYNNAGVAFSGTATATLYRANVQGV